MAKTLNLSGTLGCPNCKPGRFQPGLLIVNRVCVCTGEYKIKGRVACNLVNNNLICDKTYNVELVETAFCKCNNKSARLIGGRSCNCSSPKCQKPTTDKKMYCVCKKKL